MGLDQYAYKVGNQRGYGGVGVLVKEELYDSH